MTVMATGARANRIPIRLKTYYAYDRVDGAGVIANLSYSGALIERTATRPEIGTPITLYINLYPPSAFQAQSPFEQMGRVVRHSPSGFAIQYAGDFDLVLRRMVDDAAAVAAARH